MENADWSVIKNMPKDGCADEFKEAVKRLLEIVNKLDITKSLMGQIQVRPFRLVGYPASML